MVKSILSYMFVLFMLLGFVVVPNASAAVVAGVNIPEKAMVEGEGLILNGAGIRKKFIIKVYVGGLYLSGNADTTDAVLAQAGAKRIHMNFLYKKVDRKKIVSAWIEGFKKNNSPQAMETLKSRLDKFCTLFTNPAVKGDTYTFDYIPGKGTRVDINGKVVGTVEGDDFYKALLKVWLGSKPIDSGLKRAMLGK